MCFRIFITIFNFALILAPSINLYAENFVKGERSAFIASEKLRPRVDFWKAIFSKYGKYQSVVHHRMFPQIVFDVIDLRDEAAGMSEIMLQRYKERREKVVVSEIREAIVNLANGSEPSNRIEERVAQAMEFLGSGTAKYKRILDEDLIRTQTGIREKFADAIRRSGRYLPLMEEIFERQGLPIELTRLPFIESSFDYAAYSSVGAAGIWQFMRRTAKGYMTVNDTVDERRDPIVSSRAAAKYLAYAYQRLGAWPLAVTSYNHGVGGVAKKVQQLGTRDIAEIVEHPRERPFGFASNNFYPELLAAIEVYNEKSKLFPDVQVEPVKHFVERKMPRAMSAQQAASYFGVSISALRTVNYALSESVWSGRRSIPGYYTLKIPVGGVQSIAEEESKPDVSIIYSNELTHIVRKGETLRSIAIKYNTSEKRLKALNSLSSNKVIVGQELLVRSDKVPQTSEQEPVNKKLNKEVQTAPVVKYKIKKGDTLGAIAKRFGVTVDVLKKRNKISEKSLQIGKTIVITK